MKPQKAEGNDENFGMNCIIVSEAKKTYLPRD